LLGNLGPGESAKVSVSCLLEGSYNVEDEMRIAIPLTLRPRRIKKFMCKMSIIDLDDSTNNFETTQDSVYQCDATFKISDSCGIKAIESPSHSIKGGSKTKTLTN
jgi:hypothetical protein